MLQGLSTPVKILIGMIIPLGWGAIAYPAVRRSGRSSLTLVAIVSTLSLATLVIRELLSRYVPFSEEYIDYILGIFFGVAGISLVFNLKSKKLNKTSITEMTVNNAKLGGRVRMRYIFQAAVLVEEHGKEFYQRLSETTNNPNVKNLCITLAENEDNHRKVFEEYLSRWLPKPTDQETLNKLVDDIRKKGLFMNPPPPGTNEKEMIIYAIEQEKLLVNFYESFEQAFPSEWKKIQINKLVEQEKTHVTELEKILATL